MLSFVFSERKIWTTQSEYQKWESARYPSFPLSCRDWSYSVMNYCFLLTQAYVIFLNASMFVVPVPCRGVFWPGAAELHAGGPGKPEWDGDQWQPHLTGEHFVYVWVEKKKNPNLADTTSMILSSAAQNQVWASCTDARRWSEDGRDCVVLPYPFRERYLWWLWARSGDGSPQQAQERRQHWWAT